MAERTYKVIWKHGLAYAVEITEPDGMRRTISPFEREEEAQAWTAEAKWRDAVAASKEKPQAPTKPG